MEIKIENISFWYMSKRRKVLEDFSLQLQPDNIIGLIGRNGQGKTTLMKLLAGKNIPDKGTILYDGEEINKDRKSTRLNSSRKTESRMPSSA